MTKSDAQIVPPVDLGDGFFSNDPQVLQNRIIALNTVIDVLKKKLEAAQRLVASEQLDGYREGTKQITTESWVSIIWRAEKILRDGMEADEDICTTTEKLRSDLDFHYPPKQESIAQRLVDTEPCS